MLDLLQNHVIPISGREVVDLLTNEVELPCHSTIVKRLITRRDPMETKEHVLRALRPNLSSKATSYIPMTSSLMWAGDRLGSIIKIGMFSALVNQTFSHLCGPIRS